MRLRTALPWTSPVLAVLVFSLACAGSAAAQSAEFPTPAPDLRMALLYPAPMPKELLPPASFQPKEPAPVHRRMSPSQRRDWLLLGAADHGAAFFDARTTRVAMRHYREFDPLLRPFAHSPALYPVMQLAPFGVDWLASRMATSHHRWIRRLWWLPQCAATVGHLWAGTHNMSLPSAAGLPASHLP